MFVVTYAPQVILAEEDEDVQLVKCYFSSKNVKHLIL